MAAKINVYVRTCQGKESSTFETRMLPQSKVKHIQHYLLDQWQISKHKFVHIPPSQHSFTYKGKLLNLESHLDMYQVKHGDTIYLRIASLGPVVEPRGLSTSELRQELQRRQVYKKNQKPEQLLRQLRNELMKESRIDRLNCALRQEDREQVYRISNELKVRERKTRVTKEEATTITRPPSSVWPLPITKKRTVFLSITDFERTYQQIPPDVLETAILIFDTDRQWVFTQHSRFQLSQSDYKYFKFEPDFIELLKLKEEAAELFWFRVSCEIDCYSVVF